MRPFFLAHVRLTEASDFDPLHWISIHGMSPRPGDPAADYEDKKQTGHGGGDDPRRTTTDRADWLFAWGPDAHHAGQAPQAGIRTQR